MAADRLNWITHAEAVWAAAHADGRDHVVPEFLTPLVGVLYAWGHLADAEAPARLDYDLRLARDGAEAESTLASGLALAAVLRGLAVFGEAEVLLRWCYDALKRRHGDDDSLSLAAADQLGGLLAELGSTDEAITLRQQVLEVAERSLPPDDALALDLALDLALNLANTLAKAYRLNEAAKLYGTTFARLETLADCENESMKMSEWDGMGMPRSRSI